MKDEKVERAFKHLMESCDLLMKAAKDEELEESTRALCSLAAMGVVNVINYCFERKYGEKR